MTAYDDLRADLERLANGRDVVWPARFAFKASDNYANGYRAARADLRDLLTRHAPEPAATETPDPSLITMHSDAITAGREALAKTLYGIDGFHAADTWETDTQFTRARYEGTAEGLLVSSWLAEHDRQVKAQVWESAARLADACESAEHADHQDVTKEDACPTIRLVRDMREGRA